MRIIVLYIMVAIILNISSMIGKSLFPYVRNLTKEGIVFISLPVSKGLNSLQKFINNYIILINTQKENEQLKKQLAKCELFCGENRKKEKINYQESIKEASFSFKGNFDSGTIYIRTNYNINLKKDYCFILSENLHLIGIVKKKIKKHIYKAFTVFNPSFVADVMIIGKDNETYKALYIGNEYTPKVEFLDPNVDIKRGYKVYTSGDMGIFPKHAFIGKVRSVKNVNGYYKVATVEINRSFFNRWKVLVLCKNKQ